MSRNSPMPSPNLRLLLIISKPQTAKWSRSCLDQSAGPDCAKITQQNFLTDLIWSLETYPNRGPDDLDSLQAEIQVFHSQKNRATREAYETSRDWSDCRQCEEFCFSHRQFHAGARHD